VFVRRPGYTLIETLAAVALIGLAVAALLPAVTGRTHQARAAELIHRLGSFHRRACLLAMREGPVRVRAEEGGSALVAETAVEQIVRFETTGAEVRILDPVDRRERDGFVIDRLGRSTDQVLLLRDRGADILLWIEGRTGRLRMEEARP
jgi:prepilin-type N-terminal cleavage/methylation domain-containing protein